MQSIFAESIDALRIFVAVGEVVHEDLELFVADGGKDVRDVAFNLHHHTHDAFVFTVQHANSRTSLEILAKLFRLESQKFIQFLVRRVHDDASVGGNAFDDTFKVSQITFNDDDLITRHELKVRLTYTNGLRQRRQGATGTTSVLFIDGVADGEFLQLVQRRRISQFHSRQRACLHVIAVTNLSRAA